MRILVVDDEQDICEILQYNLGQKKHSDYPYRSLG